MPKWTKKCTMHNCNFKSSSELNPPNKLRQWIRNISSSVIMTMITRKKKMITFRKQSLLKLPNLTRTPQLKLRNPQLEMEKRHPSRRLPNHLLRQFRIEICVHIRKPQMRGVLNGSILQLWMIFLTRRSKFLKHYSLYVADCKEAIRQPSEILPLFLV